MRILLWLTAGPALALLLVWLAGAVDAWAVIGAALVGQAVVYPLWERVERRRAVRALRQLRQTPGVSVSIVRGRHTPGEAAAQAALWVGIALLVAAVFRVVVR